MEGRLLDLPMKLIMPSSFDNAKEIAFKTIRSATKVEIKTVLQSIYGLDVEKVRTANMQQKQKWKGRRLVARPSYKKAFVTLRTPISIGSENHAAQAVEPGRRSANKQ